MDNTNTKDIMDPDAPKVCDQTEEEHIGQQLFGLAVAQVSMGCFTSVKAMMDIAEYFRQKQGFPPYTPDGLAAQKVFAEMESKMIAMEAESIAQEEASKAAGRSTTPLIQKLSDEDRRRMN